MPFTPLPRLSRPQRVIVSLYLLSLAYCFCWIPWLSNSSNRHGTDTERLGYGWLWAGPRYPRSLTHTEAPKSTEPFGDVDEFVAAAQAREQWDIASSYAAPDLRLIAFRLAVLTTLGGALFVAAGLLPQKAGTST